MKDLRRISWLAILFLLLLRVSIGWQMLYEGMWKYSTLTGPDPWTSEGYLKNAQGPFRDHFREMTGDPDDLNWLDFEKMSSKWYDWRDRFAAHYQLTPEQLTVLNILIDADPARDATPGEQPVTPEVSVPIGNALPESVDLRRYADVLRFTPPMLIATAPITPREESEIKAMVDVEPSADRKSYFKRSSIPTDPESEVQPAPADEAEAAFYRAFDSLVQRSQWVIDSAIAAESQAVMESKSALDPKGFADASMQIETATRRALPFQHRLAASLLGDPDKVGVIYARGEESGNYDFKMGTITRNEEDESQQIIVYGKIREYKNLLKEYEDALSQSAIDYKLDHATKLGRKVAITRSELVGPIRSLEADLKNAALKLLTPQQRALGSLPPANTPLHRADMMAMWGLLILGSLLIIGLCTRLSAFVAAVMILSFYLVVPPFPGVPPAPGPEHSFIVNKNLIEVIALLCLAALPSGSWLGVDALLSGLFFRSPKQESPSER